jgi:hypothetical protein
VENIEIGPNFISGQVKSSGEEVMARYECSEDAIFRHLNQSKVQFNYPTVNEMDTFKFVGAVAYVGMVRYILNIMDQQQNPDGSNIK